MDTNPEIEIARNARHRRAHASSAASTTAAARRAAPSSRRRWPSPPGVADVVVCYRAFNERSGHRFGAGVQDRPPAANAESAALRLVRARSACSRPAQWVAMFARRYMHEYGATSEDFGRVAVADRKHAATNPEAWFYEQPITLEDHQASRWIVEPLHLLDCCQESDGGQALVVTTRRAGPRPAAAAGRHRRRGPGRGRRPADDDELLPRRRSPASRRWAWSPASSGRTAGLGPDDIQTAVIYDHFTPFVLPPARGVRLLRAGRGQGLRRATATSSWAGGCRSTPTAASSARPTSTA